MGIMGALWPAARLEALRRQVHLERESWAKQRGSLQFQVNRKGEELASLADRYRQATIVLRQLAKPQDRELMSAMARRALADLGEMP